MQETTTMRKVIENITREEINYTHVGLEELASELDIHEYLKEDENKRMGTVWIRVWYCTDTWVGTEAYFLDGKFVCLSNKETRKSDTHFEFISEEAIKEIKEYIISLVEEDEKEYDLFDCMDEEMPIGYRIRYPSQIMINNGHKNAIYEPTGETVEIIEGACIGDSFHKVTVKMANKESKIVNIKDLIFNWCRK